ncbi:Peptidase C14 domain containing protein [Asbolus verrucosus]|uniref:Peptidase C14 domain containing protein n=1 Tax=Asbolus verrucosus TaxID=1661398 RepID=A0A482VCM7_ASBVE|nr:Peptidase C14 domain containing protein [Asbolus verrucosus]
MFLCQKSTVFVMELSKGEKIIKNTAGLLGIFEGVTWTGLSLTCIVIYLAQMEQSINIPPTTPIHRSIIMMHAFFLYDVSPPYYRMFDGQIITSKVFDIFMWNYCILDIIWVLASFLGTCFYRHDKTKKNETNSENNIDENLAPHPYADHYKMDHPKRGTAIIFNHVKFSSSKIRKREGSNKDRDELTAVLQELDFDVIAHDDLTEKEILGVLVITSQMDHSDADCLVVVVLTHGDTDKLYARDREYPTKRLWSYFNARNCPTLAGKPKLFFVQVWNLHCQRIATFNKF